MSMLETAITSLPQLLSGVSEMKDDQRTFVIALEQDLLGACLMDTRNFVKVAMIVEDYHFCEPVHQFLYQAMEQSYKTYKSTQAHILINAGTQEIEEVLRKQVGISWKAYLTRLSVNTVATLVGVEEQAQAVVEQWGRLTLIAQAQVIADEARDPFMATGDLVSKAMHRLDEISSRCRVGRMGRKTCRMLGQVMSDALNETKQAMTRKGGLSGITWGLVDLNNLTGGIQRRDLTLIAARPSMGKTTFAVSVARSIVKSGAGVGFVSLEMDGNKIAQRMASDIAYDWNVKVSYADIIRGSINQEDMASVESALRDVGNLPMAIEEQSGLTVSQIRAKIENMVRNFERLGKRLDVVMIDHLGLIRASNRYSGNRNNEIAEMTASLKSIAREYDLAVVLLSQLNREVEKRGDKRPQLSDLRDSGAIEQDADTIIFLYREAYYLDRDKSGDQASRSERLNRLIDVKNKMEIIMAKQRNGPLKTIEVFTDMGCSAIRNWRAI